MSEIYFDNNATTKVDHLVFSEIVPFFEDNYGNPSSLHAKGSVASRAIQQARHQVAGLLGAQNSEIIFTSGGTEGNNAALFSALEANPQKTRIVVSDVEHPSVFSFCQYCEMKGYETARIPVDQQGHLDEVAFEEALTPETALCSIMHANNETGVLFPVDQFAQQAKERGILVHVDGVQSAGKVPIDLSQSAIDYFTVSGHKLHAPKGVGALYIKDGAPFTSTIWGGGQENGRRAGTENISGIVGLGFACELAKQSLDEVSERLKVLRDRLEKGLLESCDDVRVNGDPVNRIPNTTNISFKDVEGESLVLQLSEKNIYVSTGSACSSGSREPSKVLRAMGMKPDWIHGAIRFSLSRFTTPEEVETVIQETAGLINKFQRR